MDLRNNQLTGELPTGLSDLESLVELRLDSNLLTGALPAFLGNLTSLETLVVSGNGFVEERVAEEICLLRGENLQEFVVDCPTRADGQLIHGVGCSIPVCCTKCL